jgi:hypothetical protein
MNRDGVIGVNKELLIESSQTSMLSFGGSVVQYKEFHLNSLSDSYQRLPSLVLNNSGVHNNENNANKELNTHTHDPMMIIVQDAVTSTTNCNITVSIVHVPVCAEPTPT